MVNISWFYRKLTPKWIRNKRINLMQNHQYQDIRENVLKHYKDTNDTEKIKMIEWIKKNTIHVFNYEFIKKYIFRENKIYYDNEKEMSYVIDFDKKMYFKKGMTNTEINSYYNSVCLEQDEKSPHRYLSDEIAEAGKLVIFDVGAAEGNFSLRNIQAASHIFIFECDDLWIEALKVSFEPYKEKVTIVKKYVSAIDTDNMTTIDSFIRQMDLKKVDLIKMDIEGAEIDALRGARETIKCLHPEFLVCAYHRISDEREIKSLLADYFIIPREGFMLNLYDDNLSEPYFTRGVLQAKFNK